MPYEFKGEGSLSRDGSYTYRAGEGWVPTADYNREKGLAERAEARAWRGVGVAPGADAEDEEGFAEQMARMYEERVSDVMGRIPGTELRDVSQKGLLDVLEGGPMGGFREFDPTGEVSYTALGLPIDRAEGFTPEEQAFKRYWPEMESRLYGSLSRKGFTSGAAPGAAVAKGGAAFAAPLAVEHARGQERRRNQYVQELFNALQTSISGASVAGGIPWPDWMEAAQLEGAGGGGGMVIHRPGYHVSGATEKLRPWEDIFAERRT